MSSLLFPKTRAYIVLLFLGIQHVYTPPLLTSPPALLYVFTPNPGSSPLSTNSLLK
jgi:hypothetical protein